MGAVVITLGWVFNITIIGLPIGLALLNNNSMILVLQDPKHYMHVVTNGERSLALETGLQQVNFAPRTVYFVLISWWWSGIWLAVTYQLYAAITLLPVWLGMFRMTPFMTRMVGY